MSLISASDLSKKPYPLPPGHLLEVSNNGGVAVYCDDYAVVGGTASVPMELRVASHEETGAVGVDLVFLIDQSGSMKPDYPHSDPEGERFKAIKTVSAAALADQRDLLDRIAIVTFAGGQAKVARPTAPWMKWSEVPDVVDSLMQENPLGATPMEVGMQRATELLAAQNGFYKLAILLSDGLPTPDDGDYPQTRIITDQRVPEACAKRVLYSTIYLRVEGSPGPLDNPLLMYIARETDYITRYRHGDPPKYYFRIEQTQQIVQAYRELFVLIKNRRVPQNVRLVEQLNPRLLLDTAHPPTFAGNGFDAAQNVIGLGLDHALAQFGPTRCFDVLLNELKGEATLGFAVKLDLSSITPAEMAQGYVLLSVDDPASSISWLEPTAGAGVQNWSFDLPQAHIKFELGLQVIKTVQDYGGLVNIQIDNLDQNPVHWFELAEHPSGFVNPFAFEDDFGFKPLEMLYEKRIQPWFEGLIPPGLLPQSRPLRARILSAMRQALRQAHAPFLSLANQLDELLGEFSTLDLPHWIDSDIFWRTAEVRGVYRLVGSLPGKASRYLCFRIQDASLVLTGDSRLLRAPADAVVEKSEERGLYPRSKYMAKDFSEPRDVLPNELRGQLARLEKRPDLFLRTGLNAEKWQLFAPLFLGGSLRPVTPWQLLDSADITPFWQNDGQVVGVDVRLRNCGNAAATGARLNVKTYFLPFSGVSLSPPYASSPPLVGAVAHADPASEEIPPGGSKDYHLCFASLGILGSGAASPIPVGPAFLQQVRQVLAITVVEIDPAEGEVLVANNRAIEVVPISCT